MMMRTEGLSVVTLILIVSGIQALPLDNAVKVEDGIAPNIEELPGPDVHQQAPAGSDQPEVAASEAPLSEEHPFPQEGSANVGEEGTQLLPNYQALYSMTDVDLTPQAVAEYLLLSGDFAGFDDALMDLVNARILSPLEVARYKRVVGFEYENLLREMLEAEARYLQMFAKPLLENLMLDQFSDDASANQDNDTSVDTIEDLGQPEVSADNVIESGMENGNTRLDYNDHVAVQQSNADIESLLEALNTKHDIAQNTLGQSAENNLASQFRSDIGDSEKELESLVARKP